VKVELVTGVHLLNTTARLFIHQLSLESAGEIKLAGELSREN
jgi:hypothetical protein